MYKTKNPFEVGQEILDMTYHYAHRATVKQIVGPNTCEVEPIGFTYTKRKTVDWLLAIDSETEPLVKELEGLNDEENIIASKKSEVKEKLRTLMIKRSRERLLEREKIDHAK